MRLSKRSVAVALAATATMAVGAAPAAAKKTHVVHRGGSIQKAIDAAKAGDTIFVERGTYKEALQITKNRIKLVGQGATLAQPATPPTTLCSSFTGTVTGICVTGAVKQTPNGPALSSTVNGVRISGLTVKGFNGDGIFIFGGKNTRVTDTRLLKNGGYGTFSNTSSGTVYAHDVAKGNSAPGFYVGDSPKAKALIDDVTSMDNHGEGVLLRSATGGEVRNSQLRGNCAGVLVLADAPGPAGKWKIHDNLVDSNNRACAGDPAEGEPPVSGIGIALVGANHSTVRGNTVKGHHNTNPSFANSGISVVKGPGGTAPVSDVVRGNTARKNTPFDLFWDGSGSVTFKKNACGTSSPSGLCK